MFFIETVRVFFIEVSCPNDHNVVEWQDKKAVKYQKLEEDYFNRKGLDARTLPIVIGATGVVTKDLQNFLQELDCDIDASWLQKISAVETVKIVKSFLRRK